MSKRKNQPTIDTDLIFFIHMSTISSLVHILVRVWRTPIVCTHNTHGLHCGVYVIWRSSKWNRLAENPQHGGRKCKCGDETAANEPLEDLIRCAIENDLTRSKSPSPTSSPVAIKKPMTHSSRRPSSSRVSSTTCVVANIFRHEHDVCVLICNHQIEMNESYLQIFT